MSVKKYIFLVLFFVSFYTRDAFGWWEATLQQVEAHVLLTANGHAHVKYDLRYHVDRGWFEGVEINNPGKTIQWDRPNSYIEDARGRRYPIYIIYRGRDGAYLVRLARHSGLKRGWVTVHLEYNDDLRDCCYSKDSQGRPRLDWHALSWNVGMDRIKVKFQTEPYTDGLQPIDELSRDFNIQPTSDGLIIERLRPVRWYEMHVGIYFPANWLEFPLSAFSENVSAPFVQQDDAARVIPAHNTQEEIQSSIVGLLYALCALVCMLFLVGKQWITAEGYVGVQEPAPYLVLHHVPSMMRWSFIGGAFLIGILLQSMAFLSAGTLSVVGALFLYLRAPLRENSSEDPLCWRTEEIDLLQEIIAQKSSSKRKWALFLDGTSLLGFPIALVALSGGMAILLWLRRELGEGVADGIGINMILTFAVVFFTHRKKDSLPHSIERGAKVLFKASRKIFKVAESWGGERRLLVGSNKEGGEPQKVLLSFMPISAGIESIVVGVEPRLGLFGWAMKLVAEVKTSEGEMFFVQSRKVGALTRQLARKLKSI